MSDEQTGTAQRDAEATPLPMSRHSLDEPAHTSARSPVAAAGAVNSDTIQEEAAGFDERNSTDLDTGSRDAGIRRASVLSSASDATSRVVSLEAELERVTGEKDHLETQYRSLLGKLTTMRSTLGEKLRQDADELDRREQQIFTLQATNDDLREAIETLKNELIASNEESDKLHTQVEQLRTRADDSAKTLLEEASSREVQLRDVTEDLERCRSEREDWENEAMKERVQRETLEMQLNTLERELSQTRLTCEQYRTERDRQAESASNLHLVLEEFQAAKDKEIRATLGELQQSLQASSKSLREFQKRAQDAEAKLLTSQSDNEKSSLLAKEVKDKNLLIGKLRHEAVILNEHLIEALRRLKKESGENTVDRRLVTNVLISFITTPRADSKRFEMLSLLASILSWDDDEREQAGLQRTGSKGSSVVGNGRPNITMASSRRRALSRPTPRGKGFDDTSSAFASEGMEQSFSNLWVEYLLREAQSGSPTSEAIPPLPSLPTSPLTSPNATGRNVSPFSELARPQSPSKLNPSTGLITKAGYTSSKSDTDTSESTSSRPDAISSTATSVVSGFSFR